MLGVDARVSKVEDCDDLGFGLTWKGIEGRGL